MLMQRDEIATRASSTNAPGAVILIRFYVGLIFVVEGVLKYLRPDQLGTGRFAKVGIPVMENRAVMLGAGSRRFWLAGLGDQLAYRLGPHQFRGVDDLAGTLAQVTTDHPVILLVHEPDIFPNVPDRVAITLAGHTHGGQIRIPLLWESHIPSRFGTRYVYGHIVESGRHMVVSGGLGTSIVPVRLGVPPEIVHIVIGA